MAFLGWLVAKGIVIERVGIKRVNIVGIRIGWDVRHGIAFRFVSMNAVGSDATHVRLY